MSIQSPQIHNLEAVNHDQIETRPYGDSRSRYNTSTHVFKGEAAQATSIPKGTPVAAITSGPHQGKISLYDAGATLPGTDVAIGILEHEITADSITTGGGAPADKDVPVSIYNEGYFDLAKLQARGFDATVQTQLNGVVSATNPNEVYINKP